MQSSALGDLAWVLVLAFAAGCREQGLRAPITGPTPQGASETPTREMTCVAASSPSTAFYGRDDFPSTECRRRADELLAKMTPRERVAQMVQLGRDQVPRADDITALSLGSVLSGGGSGPTENNPSNWAAMVHAYHLASMRSRLGIPILYGADAVHGHNNVRGAVIFPHNVGLGAAHDPDLVERIGRATAEEVAATGVDWTFAPVVAAVRDERWGRTYEGFGESPELPTLLGPAAVRGLQGPRLGRGPSSVLACAKHFIGDGATRLGVDRGDDDLDENGLRSLLLPAYAKAIDAQVGSIMVSYSSVRGVRMHCSGRLLTDVLKRELGFNGFLVSDWEAVEQMSPSYASDLARSINAGVDMVMHPRIGAAAIDALAGLVPASISNERIADAVRRILAVKCEMGLLDPGHFALGPDGKIALDAKRLREVGSGAHRALAREAVQKSLVLVKNEHSLLPLSKNLQSVLVLGRAADNLGYQCGGWTIEWQGGSGPITSGTTIFEGVKKAVSPNTRVLTSHDGHDGARAAIVVIGEPPYAETAGDRRDLALEAADVQAVKNAKATGAPVVVVVVAGRPLILGPVVDLADALVIAWLPGSEGAGVADVLFGDAAPTGKLPHSWPKSMSDIPLNVGDARYDPLFAYGFGLTYAARKPMN